ALINPGEPLQVIGEQSGIPLPSPVIGPVNPRRSHVVDPGQCLLHHLESFFTPPPGRVDLHTPLLGADDDAHDIVQDNVIVGTFRIRASVCSTTSRSSSRRRPGGLISTRNPWELMMKLTSLRRSMSSVARCTSTSSGTYRTSVPAGGGASRAASRAPNGTARRTAPIAVSMIAARACRSRSISLLLRRVTSTGLATVVAATSRA